MSEAVTLIAPAQAVPTLAGNTATAHPARDKLFSLQILRFLAAFLVFYSHIEDRYENWEQQFGIAVPRIGLDGQLGVDIFFVISGFVMGYVALDKFGRRGASLNFAADRVSKIVPLYWALTLVQCMVFVASPHLGGHLDSGRFNAGELFKSLFFIPFLNGEGKHRPILGQGWTLNYEMAFYLVLTAALFLRRAWGIMAVSAAFVLVWLAGNALYPQNAILHILAVPIIFEFLLGFYLAVGRNMWLASGRALPRVPGITLLIASIVIGHTIFLGRHMPLWINAITGLVTVGLCVLTQNSAPKDIVRRTMVRLGDSSYSLYLSHNLTLLVVGLAWRKIFGAAALWLHVPFVIAVALIAAHLCYLTIERPGTKMLRSALHRALHRRRPETDQEADFSRASALSE